jgi:hypothetical protein
MNRAVEIRGLDRHLELKELQKRKEEELALREAEVFGLNCKFEGNTVPLPFVLNTEVRFDQNQTKIKERLMQLKCEQLKDCTFKPKINPKSKQLTVQEDLMSQYDYPFSMPENRENQ